MPVTQQDINQASVPVYDANIQGDMAVTTVTLHGSHEVQQVR